MKVKHNTPDVENEEFTAYKLDVSKSQDVYKGSKAAAKYLTKFVRETDDAYNDRLDQLTLVNYTKRTISSSRNMIFRKPLEIVGDVSELTERTLNAMGQELVVNVMRDGHTFIVVDQERYDDSVLTRADEIVRGLEPYMYIVERDRVPNWSYNDDGSYRHITINESYSVDAGYTQTYEVQQRVFKDDGVVEVWRDGEIYEVIETANTRVPVIKVGYEDLPYVYDLAKLNLNHMNRRSELNRYLKIAAAPVPVLYGVQEDNVEVVIGVDDTLNFTDRQQGGFEWVEMSGSATNLLQEDLRSLENQMVETAVSLVSADKTAQIKTATQVSSEIAEDESTLANIADVVELGMNSALEILAEMGGYQAAVHVNKDYTSNVLTAEQTAQYTNLYAQGIISLETLLETLVTGEVLPNDLNVTNEVNSIMNEGMTNDIRSGA